MGNCIEKEGKGHLLVDLEGSNSMQRCEASRKIWQQSMIKLSEKILQFAGKRFCC